VIFLELDDFAATGSISAKDLPDTARVKRKGFDKGVDSLGTALERVILAALNNIFKNYSDDVRGFGVLGTPKPQNP